MTRIPTTISQRNELAALMAEIDANEAHREQLNTRAKALMGKLDDWVEADRSEPAVRRSGDDTDARSAARALAASRR